MRKGGWCLVLTAALFASACVTPPLAQVASPAVSPIDAQVPIDPNRWPVARSAVSLDPAVEARITAIMARMTIEEKVAQTIQPDISSITPDDVCRYKFGSILAGGNSSPGGEENAPPSAWLKLADEFWQASRSAQWAGERIPLLFGIDAVHGHANVVGATIFPQNIGLGAARDPDLIRRIGEVTAREMTVTGIDWDFSPTLAVVRDDRWGRTYEGFSEDPEIVRSYAGLMVEGLQGRAGTREFLGPGRVIATAKHFVGDGGTIGGKDQGDNPSSDQEIRAVHGAGYPPAVQAGVQAVMASYSSVRGRKMHGNRELLTGALKGDLGFNGLIVGDWNGHGQLPGCSNTSCSVSFNAGLDVFMAPDSWKGLYESTLAQARSGEIPEARLDDAVRRILRVKLRAGIFEKGAPSTRPYGGRFDLLSAPEHRAVAREAVRKSLVLLKNNRQILPLDPGANVMVAGDGADNIAKQSGGWTITWQGTGLTKADFPRAQSIFSGIREAVSAAGGAATLSADGKFARRPDVAIVVFGEEPYAEFVGDRPQSREFSPADKKDLELMRRLKAAGIPVVSVFLSGRPMWVNPEINASNAFVAAFLPGGEGGGVADVLFRKVDGSIRHDFHGKLSFSWPKRADQTPLNRGDADYDPLFAYGYGLRYGQPGVVAQLPEERPEGVGLPEGVLFGRGTLTQGWTLRFRPTHSGPVRAFDRRAQEDARAFTWPGNRNAALVLETDKPFDLSRESTGQLSLVIDYRLDRRPTRTVTLGMECGPGCSSSVPIGGELRAAPVGEWRTLTIPLGCFVRPGFEPSKISAPLVIETAGQLGLSISDVRVISAAVPQDQCGTP